MTTTALQPYPDPPVEIRARGVIMGDGSGEVQVIAPESGLLDIADLVEASQRQLRPRAYEVYPGTSAVPGDYQLPVIVDQCLTSLPEVALATPEPGGYVRAGSSALTRGHYETRVLQFTCPIDVEPAAEPTAAPAAGDRPRIEAAVGEFTALRIQERLEQTLHIPPLPEAARRIIALREDPDYDLKDLVAIIETDPSLAARIMGWANSAFYRVDPPARSIDDAVVRVLGCDTVLSMALGMALGDTLRLPADHVRGLPPFWLDAVYSAATCEALARHVPAEHRPNTGLCYLAGLLANFGTLVLGHVFPPQYAKICALQEANRHLPHTFVDDHVLRLPREIVASALLESWGLPQEVADAVRYQYVHDYVGTNASYVQLVRLARQALGSQGITDMPAVPVAENDVERLGLASDQLAEVLEQLKSSKEQLEGIADTLGR